MGKVESRPENSCLGLEGGQVTAALPCPSPCSDPSTSSTSSWSCFAVTDLCRCPPRQIQAQKATLGFPAHSLESAKPSPSGVCRQHWGCVLLSLLVLSTCSRRFTLRSFTITSQTPQAHRDPLRLCSSPLLWQRIAGCSRGVKTENPMRKTRWSCVVLLGSCDP